MFKKKKKKKKKNKKKMKVQEYLVIGRKYPTEKENNPKIYRMRIFAPNDLVAKSRFWRHLRTLKKIKSTHGQVLAVHNIPEQSPKKVKNFGILLKARGRNEVKNLYKEYRDISRTGAVRQLICDMAGRYRIRYPEIEIISIDALKAKKNKKS